MNFIRRDKYALFPCKCDPIHVGHVVQIRRMLKTHTYVIIDMYDYESRVMPVEEVKEVLKDILCEKEYDRLRFRTHKTSYSESSYEAIFLYHTLTGNEAVYKKLKREAFDVDFIKEYKKYRSTPMRQYWSSKNEEKNK